MKVIVDGLAVNYQKEGEGKLVLLLHGWGDDMRTFDVLKHSLQSRFCVLSLDLPGFGATQAPSQVWDLDNYAQFIADFLTKLGYSRPFAAIGHSNGGALAIRALATQKLSADKLILLAASGIRNTKGAKRLATKAIAKVGKTATFWLPSAHRQKLRKKLYGTIGSDLLVMPQLQETFKKTVRQDVQNDAARLTLPTLLIFADHDPAVPLTDGKRYHELISNSILEVLSSNDHFVHHAEADKVNQLIKDFLS